MTEPTVLTEVRGSLGLLTLNRPRAINALDVSMMEAVPAALEAWRRDDRVQVVAIVGAGERGFCAGGDVQLLAGAGDKRSEVLSELIATFHAAVARLARAPKPLVTLVNGPAAGAGFSIVPCRAAGRCAATGCGSKRR